MRLIGTQLKCQRTVYKRTETTENGSYAIRSERDGLEIVTYDVFLDYTMLEAMAIKAAGSKGQKAKSGAVQVRVTERRKK